MPEVMICHATTRFNYPIHRFGTCCRKTYLLLSQYRERYLWIRDWMLKEECTEERVIKVTELGKTAHVLLH